MWRIHRVLTETMVPRWIWVKWPRWQPSQYIVISLLSSSVVLLFNFKCSNKTFSPSQFVQIITKTSPCNEYPLTPHFCIVKLQFTGVFIFSYFCSKTWIVGTRKNRLTFWAKKKENYHNFSSENCHFYSFEILQYIAWACFLNVFKCWSQVGWPWLFSIA